MPTVACYIAKSKALESVVLLVIIPKGEIAYPSQYLCFLMLIVGTPGCYSIICELVACRSVEFCKRLWYESCCKQGGSPPVCHFVPFFCMALAGSTSLPQHPTLLATTRNLHVMSIDAEIRRREAYRRRLRDIVRRERVGAQQKAGKCIATTLAEHVTASLYVLVASCLSLKVPHARWLRIGARFRSEQG